MSAPFHGLLEWIEAHPAYVKLQQQLQTGLELPPQPLLPAATPALLATLTPHLEVPLLVVVPGVEESRRLLQALRFWLGPDAPLLPYPEPPTLPYEHAPWTPETIADRTHVLATLFLHRMGAQEGQPPLIVASLRALMQRTLPYRQFRRAARHLEPGHREPLTSLIRHCSNIGYEAVSVVETPGQYSHRGGILDIFPPHTPTPYRLEFFGDEIDSLRTFDPATQRSIARAAGFWLTPVREALPRDSERARLALDRLLTRPIPPELHGQLEQERQALEAGVPFPTLEYYLPYLYQEVGALPHHLPDEALVVLYNAPQHAPRWAALEAEALAQRERATAENLLPSDAPSPILTWEHWQEALGGRRTLAFGYDESAPLGEALSAGPHFAGRLDEAMGRIRQWVSIGDQVVVLSRQAERLAELWQDFTSPPVLKALPQAPQSLITFVNASAPGGWQLHTTAGTRHLITDEELFGWQLPEPRRRPRRRVTAPEFPFADLEPGNAVVHEDYGIGLFQGLVQRSVDDITREYLLLEYAGRDRLYVPIHQADRLSRYVGPESFTPSLSRLGSAEWSEAKTRVRQATAEMARELLELYAARQIVEGYAFAPDTPWQAELEAAFPYIETEDQLQAIAAVKEDMEQTRPMDRLICGDAGYGKTEVALRAAFKAVMDDKQVALLVPTTVLAQQHFQTFQQRLAPFPVRVELLSRFRTGAEQRQVLAEMTAGQVDIVIGTHRLLQKDVRFKDLGLVIIDEEQRFGVGHKERLKQLRTEVDVLTLTATPIPRTLYMALTGVRDVNIIETPPQERLPISTYVGPYEADIARRAILREVQRGGQVFYVHNRVESIRSVASRLQQLAPEARIGVGHGRMRERELERVMQKFTGGEIDVLLATTIIESGLDFPNANTLIVERADRFGLAQLYQLRGRVGRGTRRGYAYFFHGRRVKDEARQRLDALQETGSVGGGFSIALRDLELRGAGDLLGTRQHGSIAAVGFTLYTRMLTRAVERLKAERADQPAPPRPLGSITIELPLAVGLPPEYVPDDTLRLQLYRRLAELTLEDEIAQLQEELQDRFGPLPKTAQNLLYQLRLKVLARDARIPSIAVESGQIALRLPWLQQLENEQLITLRLTLRAHEARVGRREIWLPISWEQEQWRQNLESVLEALAGWWEAQAPTTD